MYRRNCALALACFLSSSVSGAQSADDAGKGKPRSAAAVVDPRAEADALIQQGIQLRREKRDAEALERFVRARELQPSARASAQIGLAELALNRWLAAETHLREALASKDDWVLKNGKTLEASLNAALDRLAVVEVTSNVPRVELWINGTP